MFKLLTLYCNYIECGEFNDAGERLSSKHHIFRRIEDSELTIDTHST